MASESINVGKIYSSSFILDKAKFARILNIIEDRFGTTQAKYELTLKNGKNIKLNGIEEVFNTDNSIKNPIKSLDISIVKAPDASESVIISYDDSKSYNIVLKTKGNDSKETNQLFAELEEQIERTLLTSWIYKINKLDLPFFLFTLGAGLIILLIAFFSEISTNKLSDTRLTNEEINYLKDKGKLADNLDKKIDFLFELNSKQVSGLNNSRTVFNVQTTDLLTKRSLLIGIPLLLFLGLIIYVIFFHYPTGIFLWGDYEEYYNQIVARRKNLWSVVIIGLFINIIAGLFVTGLFS